MHRITERVTRRFGCAVPCICGDGGVKTGTRKKDEDRDVGGRTREERDPPTKRRGDAVDDGGSSRIEVDVMSVLCCTVV